MTQLNIVISGCFNTSAIEGYGRNQVRSMIEHYGHHVRSQLSGSTDYLCIGTANVPGRGVGPSKLRQAHDMGIKIITQDELMAVLEEA